MLTTKPPEINQCISVDKCRHNHLGKPIKYNLSLKYISSLSIKLSIPMQKEKMLSAVLKESLQRLETDK